MCYFMSAADVRHAWSSPPTPFYIYGSFPISFRYAFNEHKRGEFGWWQLLMTEHFC
jgi:hypothetical protein